MQTNGLTPEHSFFLWSSSYTVKAALSLGPAEQCPLPKHHSLHHPMGLGQRVLTGPRPVLVLGDPSRRRSQRMWPAFSPPPTGCLLISQIPERELQYLLDWLETRILGLIPDLLIRNSGLGPGNLSSRPSRGF